MSDEIPDHLNWAGAYDPEAEAEYSEFRRRDALRALVELRRASPDHCTFQEVTVVVARCASCCFSIGEETVPSICARSWEQDVRELGFSSEIVQRLREDPTIECDLCGGRIVYGTDDIHTAHRAFEDYFSELLPDPSWEWRRKAPKEIRHLVYQAYEGMCFGCKKPVPWEEKESVPHPDKKSIDHIQPQSKEGRSALVNLQLLCRQCDEAKADLDPVEEGALLYFPLYPPPSDGYDGVVW